MSDYDKHSSQPLQQLFKNQEFPHQGQDPWLAKIVIIGLDANYAPEISQFDEFFTRVIEYHKDGVAFWQKYEVHHPFILESYPLRRNTGGVPYHRRFNWMNLTSDYAQHVSFIELLPIPTKGRTGKRRFWELFDVEHAERIDRLIATGAPRIIILSKSLVSNYMLHAKKTRGGICLAARRISSWPDKENRGYDYLWRTSFLIDNIQEAGVRRFRRLLKELL